MVAQLPLQLGCHFPAQHYVRVELPGDLHCLVQVTFSSLPLLHEPQMVWDNVRAMCLLPIDDAYRVVSELCFGTRCLLGNRTLIPSFGVPVTPKLSRKNHDPVYRAAAVDSERLQPRWRAGWSIRQLRTDLEHDQLLPFLSRLYGLLERRERVFHGTGFRYYQIRRLVESGEWP